MNIDVILKLRAELSGFYEKKRRRDRGKRNGLGLETVRAFVNG